MENVFEKIIKGAIPCDKVFESEEIIAFKDTAPQAPVHILIVPKKKIASLAEMREGDLYLMQEIVAVAQKLAVQFQIGKNFRLVTNSGPMAGQSVFQLHFHLLGGKPLNPQLA